MSDEIKPQEDSVTKLVGSRDSDGADSLRPSGSLPPGSTPGVTLEKEREPEIAACRSCIGTGKSEPPWQSIYGPKDYCPDCHGSGDEIDALVNIVWAHVSYDCELNRDEARTGLRQYFTHATSEK